MKGMNKVGGASIGRRLFTEMATTVITLMALPGAALSQVKRMMQPLPPTLRIRGIPLPHKAPGVFFQDCHGTSYCYGRNGAIHRLGLKVRAKA